MGITSDRYGDKQTINAWREYLGESWMELVLFNYETIPKIIKPA
jgi:hypothetical protein|tara:strand:+ start:522 stop:653 length:132 start_codon:yes stop_codon:yes gene_type:complete